MTPATLLRRFFPPMLATLADGPPANDAGWTYELKYDGFRAIIGIAGGEMAMWSRNQIDLAGRFPRIAAAVKKLKVPDVVLDGEIVALDEQGTAKFQLLQQGNRERLVIFDILHLDGKDLRKRTYDERRALLEKLLKKSPAEIVISEKLAMTGAAALELARGGGHEGIIAKRNDSIYENRRSKEWLKVKAINQQELIVVGWHPSKHSSKEIGSLHLAVKDDDGALRYAGKVGTGFSAKLRVWLRDELAKDAIDKPMVKDAPRSRDATWVKPRLVAQVSFTEWTSDHRLRHPSFLGMREDKSVGEVVMEKPIAVAKAKAQGSTVARKKPSTKKPGKRATAQPEVTLTSPDRIVYPRDGITKADVAAYYEAVSGPMIHALRDRPLALEHWNGGIDKPSWFHQGVGKEAPEWLTVIDTPTRSVARKSVRHPVVDSPAALRWLAQMSALTIHMWSSRGESLENPDWVLFDLDPAKGKGIEQAIEAAIVMRKLLENLELPSVPKTSGKRGIHVLVPLAKGYTHEEAADWAFTVASTVAAQVPGLTVERSLAKRRGRLYLDAMQNGYGKTVVAPYSLRAIDGAPVSAPLKWSEITKKLDPLQFNLRTMPHRLAKVGDLFAEVFKKGVKLPKFG
ncbi:MAG TPA: DNA ligase D [Thermoanaerobaculia bacterium]|jgi:bifunctional non-homologous end joining protein LigD